MAVLDVEHSSVKPIEARMRMIRATIVRLVQAAVIAVAFFSAAYAADTQNRSGAPAITVLDSAGRVVKTINPEQDQAARNAQTVDLEQQRIADKADAEQRRKDRVLLGSYTTEPEIDLARNRAASAITAQMEGTRQYLAALDRRRAAFEKTKKETGKALPAADAQELARLQTEMGVQNASLLQKQADLDKVNARYDADKKRWEELNVATPKPAVATSAQVAK
jgi:hypothetical protein